MKKLKEDKYSYKLIIFSICTIVLVIMVGTSFALWSGEKLGSLNTINSGTITFLYTEPSNDVTLMTNESTDENIIKETTNYMDFTISGIATDKINLAYYIYFNENADNTVTKDSVKFYLSEVTGDTETSITGIKEGSTILPINLSTLKKDTTSSNYLLYSSTMSFPSGGSTITKNYRLRFWVSGSGNGGNITYTEEDKKHTASMSGNYSIKLNVYTSLGEAVTIS